jgi:hypothetical protein
MPFTTRLKAVAKAALGRPQGPSQSLPPVSQSGTLRTVYFHECLKKVSHLDGALIECGVGQGYGLCTWLTLTALEPRQRVIWAFDSFEGFPKFAKEDQTSAEREAGYRQYKQFDLLYVFNTMTSFGLAPAEINRRISFAKGFIPQSLSQFDKGPIALLHLDLDIFEPYKEALSFFWDYVVPGGIVMFDEYNKALDIFKFPGAQKAINDFLDARDLRGALRKDTIYGNVYIQKPLMDVA